MNPSTQRRKAIGLALVASAPLMPAFGLTVTPSTTEGPYYTMSSANTILSSSSSNYAPHLFTTEGTDNDMIHIYSSSTQATGTVTKVSGTLVNTSGATIAGAVVELWVADNNGIYWYVSSSSGTNNFANRDKNFQGYGKCTTDSSGAWSFLTIKPGLYTGRIRHYHLKVRIGGTEYLTTQLMPADEAAATPSDNVVSGLGSNLSRCTYTPTTGTITWGSSTYSGQIVSDRQLVVSYTVTAPGITTSPSSLTVTAGQSATFTVVASGTAPLTYQWYKGTTAISSATSASYTISSTTTSDAGSYSCKVTNGAGTATSNAATLTVNTPVTAPDITTDPASKTVDVGAAVAFQVVATGTSLNYQWYKGGSSISGANAATYSIASAKLSDAGSFYVIVSNTAGTDTSGTATLTVNEPFKTFLAYYGISSSTAAADPDNDGIPNLLEFLLGGNPSVPGTGIQPTSQFTTVNGSSALVYSFYVVKDTGTATWAVEYNTALSSDAASWTTAVAGTNGVTITTQDTETAGLSYVTVRIPTTQTKLFARLRVTPPTN
ncbi:immunoglobulin domain-containing protein [Luteolibacter sp. LG18]|uniref:immunoglobulin domain-containing protein n=1 Tax=Luteolibacter sp. LG18 TaxID=2819286 RepID=UPI002B2E16FC|nr:hypothetical protein llg_27500 [Luteolibacter sp. LG18]